RESGHVSCLRAHETTPGAQKIRLAQECEFDCTDCRPRRLILWRTGPIVFSYRDQSAGGSSTGQKFGVGLSNSNAKRKPLLSWERRIPTVFTDFCAPETG